jgi:hypothetical protein
VTADDQRVGARAQEVLERVVRLEGVAIVPRSQALHVVVAYAVAQEQRAERGLDRERTRERAEDAPSTIGEEGASVRVGERAHLIGEQPALVVAKHDQRARVLEQRDAALDVAATVGDVADAEDAAHPLSSEELERAFERAIFGVDVADQTEDARWNSSH